MLCGDMNVTRSDVDVHPKERQPNLIGQRPEERELFEKLGEHLADVGRTLDPDNPNRFTWWAPWRNLRQRNIGWRIASPAIAGHAASCAGLHPKKWTPTFEVFTIANGGVRCRGFRSGGTRVSFVPKR